MEIQDYNAVFYEIVSKYDLTDNNIMRKLVHSFLVADSCFSIASSQYMPIEERKFAYVCGLMHDIGRMEQWNCFASFSDSRTRHHAKLGADLLVKTGAIEKLGLSKSMQNVLLELVKYHAIPYTGKDKDVLKFLPILRNADNYVNLQNAASGMEKLWTTKSGVTPELLKRFQERENLHGIPITTKLDRILQFLSRAYSIELPLLKKDFLARKYLNSIYEVYSAYLNISDKKILYEECWRLKREFALQLGAK